MHQMQFRKFLLKLLHGMPVEEVASVLQEVKAELEEPKPVVHYIHKRRAATPRNTTFDEATRIFERHGFKVTVIAK